MKLFFFYIVFLFLFCSCSKEETYSREAELAKLPAETQSGKWTVGCLVNGKAFLPTRGSLGSPTLQCYYQQLGSLGDFFSLSFSNISNSDRDFNVNINTDSLAIEEGQLIPLVKHKKGVAVGRYLIVTNTSGINEYSTTDILTGQLHVKKLDPVQSIVAGTFWFTAVDAAGDTVRITDGRFDMPYTK